MTNSHSTTETFTISTITYSVSSQTLDQPPWAVHLVRTLVRRHRRVRAAHHEIAEAVVVRTGTSTDDPGAAEAVFLDATLRLLEPLRVAPGDVAVDMGPGAGALTSTLAVGEPDLASVWRERFFCAVTCRARHRAVR
ncbi:hypothetical protein ACWDO0_03565 [Nocardia rhamnosiphila]